MSTTVDYQEGDFIPFHLTPSIVVASFFVSLIGAITTVELLQRRTHVRGWYSWFELLSCSISFGLVAIWCMHFVGMRAIVLGDGNPTLQLYFNPGFTALTVFLPILALFAAFTIADRRHHGKKTLLASLFACGIISAQAIVGMHYTASFGIANYAIHYNPKFIGGAMLIASAACVTALTLIFMLQDRWISILPYRIIAAIVLAGAVCGMHYEATMGTSYELKQRHVNSPRTRNMNVIIATVLSLLTIPVCFAIAWSTSRRQKQLADRAQQVILACARFDPEGKIMVTAEGLLPCQSITVHENQRCFEDEFNVTHPAFQWIFRVSHDWPAIMRWVPKMRRHLKAINFINDDGQERKLSEMNDTASLLDWDVSGEGEDYSLIFRQSFCVAAADLASDFKEPLSDIGTLHDEVMMTGTLAAGGLHRRQSVFRKLSFAPKAVLMDLEAAVGVDVFGKGQLLFLVQQVDAKNATRLTTEGFRFVPLDKVESHLAKSMQVPTSYLNHHMKSLWGYSKAKQQTHIPTGTLLGCFILRAGILKRSWDVVVKKDAPYRIPYVQFSPLIFDPALAPLLTQLDGMSVTNCLARLNVKLESPDEPNKDLWELLRKKIVELQEQMREPFFSCAIFSSKITKIPTWDPEKNRASFATLLAFHIIPDIHQSQLHHSPDLTHTPISFLRCRQQVLEGVKHRASFERKTHREFACLFTPKQETTTSSRPGWDRRQSGHPGKKAPFSDVVPLTWFSPAQPIKHASTIASLRSLASRAHPGATLDEGIAMQANMPFGGIMVSSDVTVEAGPKDPSLESVVENVSTAFAVDTAGTSAYASHAETETTTYIDELFATAVARWQRT